jgi:hypothetical protein
MLGNAYVNSDEHSDGMDETGGMHKGQLDRKDWSVISGMLDKPCMDFEYEVSVFKFLSNLI